MLGGALFVAGFATVFTSYGPTLGVILRLATSSGSAGRGAVLTFAYSLGLGLPFLISAVSVRAVMRRFGWARRQARTLMTVGGGMLIVLGVLQVTGVWFELMTRLQVLVLDWQSPL